MKIGSCAVAAALLSTASGTSKTRPVMKIVRMLQDMQKELQLELEDDKAVYEKLQCWCKTGADEKQKAIEMSEATIAQLDASMDGIIAKMEELKEKRKSTLAEVNSDHASKTEADEARIKDNKQFQAEETDLLEAVAASKQALVVLGKHNPSLAQVREAVHSLQMARVSQLVSGATTLDNVSLEALKKFIHSGNEVSFLQIPGMKSYAPQSGQIFGILQQMQVDFEKNLADLQAKEKKAVEEYESLKAAKVEEIKAGRDAVAQLDEDLANLLEKHAQQAKELKDTQEQLANDKTFLANLDEQCATADADYQKRVKDRLVEIAAVEDTIKILNNDEAFDAFDNSLNHEDKTGSAVGFFQVHEQKNVKSRAAAVLRRAARSYAAPALALLASKAELDAFVKVKAEIDKLVAEYKKQQADEVAQRDECIDDLAKNDRETAKGYDKKTNLETKIADLQKSIETMSATIVSSNTEMEELKVQMKRAGETRELENLDNTKTMNDQHVTQIILQKALDRMKEAYAFMQGPGGPHTQTSATKTDPGNGPARFKQYEENAGGARVLKMLETVLADSKQAENDAYNSETHLQARYEIFMKDSNKFLKDTTEKVTNLTGSVAKAKENLSLAKSELVSTVGVLGDLNDVAKVIHSSCDYLLKNFEVRQTARAAEIEAMIEAKNILSGMK